MKKRNKNLLVQPVYIHMLKSYRLCTYLIYWLFDCLKDSNYNALHTILIFLNTNKLLKLRLLNSLIYDNQIIIHRKFFAKLNGTRRPEIMLAPTSKRNRIFFMWNEEIHLTVYIILYYLNF
jgi:hypothetical protein